MSTIKKSKASKKSVKEDFVEEIKKRSTLLKRCNDDEMETVLVLTLKRLNQKRNKVKKCLEQLRAKKDLIDYEEPSWNCDPYGIKDQGPSTCYFADHDLYHFHGYEDYVEENVY